MNIMTISGSYSSFTGRGPSRRPTSSIRLPSSEGPALEAGPPNHQHHPRMKNTRLLSNLWEKGVYIYIWDSWQHNRSPETPKVKKNASEQQEKSRTHSNRDVSALTTITFAVTILEINIIKLVRRIRRRRRSRQTIRIQVVKNPGQLIAKPQVLSQAS